MKHYDIVVIQTPLTCSASCGRKCNSNKSILKKTPGIKLSTRNTPFWTKKQKGRTGRGNEATSQPVGTSARTGQWEFLPDPFLPPVFSIILAQGSASSSLCPHTAPSDPRLSTKRERGRYLPVILIVKSSLCSIISLPPVAAVGLYCSRYKFSLELKNRAIFSLLFCLLWKSPIVLTPGGGPAAARLYFPHYSLTNIRYFLVKSNGS